MAESGESQGRGQRPNMWEELNRPRRIPSPDPTSSVPPPPQPHAPLPPPPQPPPSEATDDVGHNAGPDDDQSAPVVPSAAAVAMKRIDSQYLLLVGGVMFVVVALVALRGLSDSPASSTGPDEAASSSPAPERLPSVEQPPTTLPPATPSTTEGPTAMGLPAELLDGPQSSVYRLYRTALGREPDRNGFQYWADQVRAGTPLDTLAQQFLASDEFGVQFADAASADERTVLLIRNAFGPTDDQQQMKIWLERYRGLEGATLLLAISEADETLAFTGTLR